MNLSDLDATHNAALFDLLADRIRASGPISFAEFYETALYHPRHGYYFTSDPTRDFQSSPNVHPVFGAAIARRLAAFWRDLGSLPRFDVFEAGASTGRLAADVLRYLRTAEPRFYDAIRYVIQDVTLTAESATDHLLDLGIAPGKVDVAAALPVTPQIEGCILSNELLDALPFHRVRRREGELYELLVGFEDGAFVDVEASPRPDITAHFEALGVWPGEGCDAEVNLVAPAWIARAASALRRGYVLTLDYGYEATGLYAAWRKRGTLLTFYRHTSGDDPYARIGRQDITASVDFTSVFRAGDAAGLHTVEFTTQAEFLAALGIGGALAQPPPGDQLEAYTALRRAVVELTDPSRLGRIRVLIQAKSSTDTQAAHA
ncbi:MAG TPA: SAM-dependent methyltransferase [Dehalococcoidia bacterium]|nr:SAM-dependent methyltransferase [Dehalococcoidia bacterium]